MPAIYHLRRAAHRSAGTFLMAGLVPATHVFRVASRQRRGLPQQARHDGYGRAATYFKSAAIAGGDRPEIYQHRHGRARPCHPRLRRRRAAKTWVPSGMTDGYAPRPAPVAGTIGTSINGRTLLISSPATRSWNYSCLNFGGRFSTKAAMPSFWSAVANKAPNTRRSKRKPSASGTS